MNEKILAFLKGKLTGTSEAYLIGIANHFAKTITDESQIEATLNDGAIDLLKLNSVLFQVEGDRRATEATKTAILNYQKKNGLDENGKPIVNAPENPNPSDPNTPQWFKEYLELQKKESTEIKQKLESFDKEKKTTELSQKIKSHEKLKDIPELYLKGRIPNVESEDQIEGLVSGIVEDYNAYKQFMVEQGIIIDTPRSPAAEAKEGSEFGERIAEQRNKGAVEQAGPKAKTI